MERYIAVESLISLLAIAWLYRRCFVPMRIDNFRSDIRRTRNELFDFMWKNSLDFSDPAYRETRQMLNGLLRASNQLSVISLIWHALQMRGRKIPPAKFRESPNGLLKNRLHETWDFAASGMLHLIFMEGIAGVVIVLYFTA